MPLPDGFELGHWTDAEARTGCTVVIAPPGARGGVDVRGGGTGTREIESLSALANSEGPDAVLLTGGSAFGLAAADGVSRWLEERGRGRPTPAGVVPLVPAAVVYDLVEGNSGARPGPEQGYAACEHAAGSVPERGALGAGAGAAVGKLDPPNATVLVDELESQGLVQRRPHPTDRRAKLVEATRKGKSLARRANEILATPPLALAGLSAEDLDTLRRILTSLERDRNGNHAAD